MYPTLAKDGRTENDGSKNEKERVCIYTKTAYTLPSLQSFGHTERETQTLREMVSGTVWGSSSKRQIQPGQR